MHLSNTLVQCTCQMHLSDLLAKKWLWRWAMGDHQSQTSTRASSITHVVERGTPLSVLRRMYGARTGYSHPCCACTCFACSCLPHMHLPHMHLLRMYMPRMHLPHMHLATHAPATHAPATPLASLYAPISTGYGIVISSCLVALHRPDTSAIAQWKSGPSS